MNVDETLKTIEKELSRNEAQRHSEQGRIRLQEKMKEYAGEDELVWSDELLKEIQERPKKAVMQTKLPLLDDLIGGFRGEQLITLSASTKHGKTAMSMFLMEQLEEYAPVMIPLEQSNEELVEQRHENGYSIPRFLSPRNLAARVTVDWIEQRIIEGIAKYNTKFVVIDHLGYINDQGTDGEFKRENLAYRIGQIMKALKNIAKKWNVAILLLVHISQHDEGKPPSLEDIKNSSDIIQESDMVLMLWRKNEIKNKIRIYRDETLLSVMANRRTGRNGNVGLKFNTQTGRYEEEHSWVKSMEDAAMQEIANDEDFAGYGG